MKTSLLPGNPKDGYGPFPGMTRAIVVGTGFAIVSAAEMAFIPGVLRARAFSGEGSAANCPPKKDNQATCPNAERAANAGALYNRAPAVMLKGVTGSLAEFTNGVTGPFM